LNIFIYGNQSFKKDIQKILKDSKINKVLDDLKIVEVNELQLLKENISLNPNDIYLIDDDSIIRKKSKFNFFKPKDGIEEEFLLECGVDDLSIDSMDDLPNYIIRKHNRQNLQNNKVEEIDAKPSEQNSSIDLKEIANVNDEPSNENQTEKIKEEDSQNSENEANVKEPTEESKELIEDKKNEEGSKESESQDNLEAIENVEDENLDQDNINNILESKEEESELNSETKADSIIEEDIQKEPKDDEDEQNMEEEKQDDFSSLEDFSEDFGLNNVSYDYDDDAILNDNAKKDEELLADILSSSSLNEDYLDSVTETFEDTNFLDEIFPGNPIVEAKDNIDKSAKNDEKIEGLENHLSNVVEVDKKTLKQDNSTDLQEEVIAINDEKTKIEDNQNSEDETNIKGLTEDKNIDLIDELGDFVEKKEIVLKNSDETEDVQSCFDDLNKLDKEENFKDIYEFEGNTQGDDSMSDEFFELDSLNEQDLIAALTGEQNSIIEAKNESKIEPKNAENVIFDGSNAENIASLISKLLDNKTLEITIKAKD